MTSAGRGDGSKAKLIFILNFNYIHKLFKLRVPIHQKILIPGGIAIIIVVGSGCGSVGRAVASDSRGLRFKSSHRQKFIFILNICLLSTVY